MHVDDLSSAHIAAFEKLEEPGQQLFFNLGIGKSSSVKEVISTVEKVSGLSVPFEYADRRPGDPPALFADSTMANDILGWEPKFPDLEAIVETAWKWNSSHPDGFDD